MRELGCDELLATPAFPGFRHVNTVKTPVQLKAGLMQYSQKLDQERMLQQVLYLYLKRNDKGVSNEIYFR